MNPNEGAPNKKLLCDKYRERFGDRAYYELMISLNDGSAEYCPSEFWDISNPGEDEYGDCLISCAECWGRTVPEKKVDKGALQRTVLDDIRKSAEKAGGKKIMTANVPETTELTDSCFAEDGYSPVIKDSGDRTEFETGAVRDMREGKGRMDLLPWAAIMEVSKHCENGAKKYGEHNVDKGIPTSSLCDSAARHLAKYLDGWTDENHLLASAWNLLWAIQMEIKNKEVVDTPWRMKQDTTTDIRQE